MDGRCRAVKRYRVGWEDRKKYKIVGRKFKNRYYHFGQLTEEKTRFA